MTLGFFFCIVKIYMNLNIWPTHASVSQHFTLSSQVCMLCSVGYHLFSCHRSEKNSRRWMALDYAGISIGIIGCYVPGVFYAFYCNNVCASVILVRVLLHQISYFYFFFFLLMHGILFPP